MKDRKCAQWTAATLSITLLGLITLVGISFVSFGQEAATSSEGQYRAELSNGVVVELVGISVHPSSDKVWKKPDGGVLEDPPYDELRGAKVTGNGSAQLREFAIRLANLPEEDTSTSYSVEPADAIAAGTPVKGSEPVEDMLAFAASIPADKNSCTVSVGVASGYWETLASTRGKVQAQSSKGGATIIFSQALQTESGTRIVVSDSIVSRHCRIVATDSSGEQHTPSESDTAGNSVIRQSVADFEDVRPDEIVEFRFQVLPAYEWVHFRNIQLVSGAFFDPVFVAFEEERKRAKEELLKKLEETTVSLNFTDADMREIFDFLAGAYGVNFIIDDRYVAEEGMEDETGVTKPGMVNPLVSEIDVENVPMKDALEVLLEPLGLEYEVQSHFVFLSTQEGMRDAGRFEELRIDPGGEERAEKLNREKIDIDFTNVDIRKILDFVRSAYGVEIKFDDAIELSGLPENAPEALVIMSRLTNAPLRDGLKAFLIPMGLDYRVTADSVYVTTLGSF